MAAVILPAVCFVACHGGPAHHFSYFTKELETKGYEVVFFATGPAFDRVKDLGLKELIAFSLDTDSEEDIAADLAKKCAKYAVVITDVGLSFPAALHKNLAQYGVRHYAYYDNSDVFFPGSDIAAKVMVSSEKVLFANKNLAQTALYRSSLEKKAADPDYGVVLEEVQLPSRAGIGFSPMEQVDKIVTRRASDREALREKEGVQEKRVLVYAGGNNPDYFDNAFPAFLKSLTEACEIGDLSHSILLLQQHPGAKKANIDGQLFEKTKSALQANANAPEFRCSAMTSDDAQVIADTMIYYQTTMAPGFLLAGIPTIQAGHRAYPDLLVRNKLCPVATTGDELLQALSHSGGGLSEESAEQIRQGLGLDPNWARNLEAVIQP